MKLYKDRFSGGELFSDTYPCTLLFEGQVYKVKGKLVTRKEGIDDSLIGANASQEEASEGTDEAMVSGIDVVLDNRLQETAFAATKKDFQSLMKDKMKIMVQAMKDDERSDDDVEAFKKGMVAFVKDFASKAKLLQFFCDEKFDEKSIPTMVLYDEEDGSTPYLYFVKEMLVEEKV